MKNNLLSTALNPLHQHIIVAQCLVQMQELSLDYDLPVLPEAETEDFVTDTYGNVIYPTIEKAGEAGMYHYLNEQGLKVIFANDLVSEIHGLDAIAYDCNINKYVICESKGTVVPIKSKREYLAKTKDKGRQLSWEWCWASICEMALYGPSAQVFLEIYEPYLLDRVERLLSVASLTKHPQGYIIEKTTVFDEKSLHSIDFLAEKKKMENQLKWTEEIKQINHGNYSTLS